ncbi:hypothetical protein L3V77_22915 [Vibrio sp. DW001]|uniref:hypothetical protein n=1 Tax=Vibrio sp. DW001 TaxID=2912315 RepID=UPI0023AF3E56|nr:hypothetical protein [Vibrio sp. DW001]WED28792.1 hypothetical protein L3V77_22915 [Vibrio sp. DW001]
MARYKHRPSHYLGVIFPDEQDFMMMRLKFHRKVKIVYVFNGFNWGIGRFMAGHIQYELGPHYLELVLQIRKLLPLSHSGCLDYWIPLPSGSIQYGYI